MSSTIPVESWIARAKQVPAALTGRRREEKATTALKNPYPPDICKRCVVATLRVTAALG